MQVMMPASSTMHSRFAKSFSVSSSYLRVLFYTITSDVFEVGAFDGADVFYVAVVFVPASVKVNFTVKS